MKYLLVALMLLSSPALAWSDEAADAASIRQRVDSYVAAYNRGDAKALADHWSAKAVYVDQASGRKVEGRAAIEAMFAELFQDDVREHLEATVDSIRFVAANVAVEEGVAQIVSPDEPPFEASYTAIHVKEGDQWYLDSVRETARPARPSHRAQLEELSWMIGQWVDSDDNATVRADCKWTKNHNFITRSFNVSIQDRVELEGTQVIGWDAAAGTIRSWTFDTDGGFAQSVWSRDGNRWTIKSTAVLPDGRRGAHVRILTYIDDNTITLQTVTREVGGKILPNIDEFTVVRVQSEQ